MPTQDGSLGKKLDARCEFALINDKKMGFPFWVAFLTFFLVLPSLNIFFLKS
jgi:hypothetical protein